jgi:hypothetical protein
MTRLRPLLALIFALGLLAAGCPDDIEEAIEQDPDDPLELVRSAASQTLGEGTAEATITIAGSADAEEATTDEAPDPTDDTVTDEDTTTTEDDTTGTEDDGTATDDDTATTNEDDTTGAEDDETATDDTTTGDDIATTDDETAATDDVGTTDPDAMADELRIQSEEDFGQELRRLVFETGTQTLGGAEDAPTSDILVDGTWVYVPLDESGPEATTAPEEDDTVGAEDDDTATEDDDTVTADETVTEDWGRFDLRWLDEDESDAGDDTEITTTTNNDLHLFPFRDSHAILVILENAEGEATQGDDTDGAAVTQGTSYEVTLDVDETAAAAGDAGVWLERRAAGQDTFSVTVWIDDDERIVGVVYAIGGNTADDDLGTTTDEDATTEDDTTATETDDDVAGTDEVTQDDLTNQDELLVTIEYTQFGIDLEIDSPDEDQVEDIDEQELARHLPALPASDDADQLTPTQETTP